MLDVGEWLQFGVFLAFVPSGEIRRILWTISKDFYSLADHLRWHLSFRLRFQSVSSLLELPSQLQRLFLALPQVYPQGVAELKEPLLSGVNVIEAWYLSDGLVGLC
jgi:hypothetical protein